MSILCLCAAMGMKNGAIIVAPIYGVAFFFSRIQSERRRSAVLWFYLGVFIAGSLLSGSVWTYVSNYCWYGDWRGLEENYSSALGSLRVHDVATRMTRGVLYLTSDFGFLPDAIEALVLRVHRFALQGLGLGSALATEGGYYSFEPWRIPQRAQLGIAGSVLFIPSVLYFVEVGAIQYLRTRTLSLACQLSLLSIVTFWAFHAVLNWQPGGLVRLSLVFALFGGTLLSVCFKNRVLRFLSLALAICNVVLLVFSKVVVVSNTPGTDTHFLQSLNRFRNGSQVERTLIAAGVSRHFSYYDSGNPDARMLQEIARWLPERSAVGILVEGEVNLFFERPDLRMIQLFDCRTGHAVRPRDSLDFIVSWYPDELLEVIEKNKLRTEEYVSVLNETREECIRVVKVLH